MAKVTPFACAAALATAKAWGERTIQAMEGSGGSLSLSHAKRGASSRRQAQGSVRGIHRGGEDLHPRGENGEAYKAGHRI